VGHRDALSIIGYGNDGLINTNIRGQPMANTIKKRSEFDPPVATPAPAVLKNQSGSVTVMVLLILAIMTVIGIVSSETVVTENFISRNVGIHKQNIGLAQAALMRGLQEFMQLDNSNPDNFNQALNLWINDQSITTAGAPEELINTIWYENEFTQPCLNFNNSLDANTTPLFMDNVMPFLGDRGENANGNLRYAVVGWQPVSLGATGGSTSVTTGTNNPTWREGRIIAEYVSLNAARNDNGFGLIRQEIGVKRQW
jgi:hypothetical protein